MVKTTIEDCYYNRQLGGPEEYSSGKILCLKYIKEATNDAPEQTVGIAFFNLDDPENDVLYVEKVQVDPQFQRKGIGSRLMNAIEQNHKPRKISTFPHPANKAAASAFYKKLGFEFEKDKYEQEKYMVKSYNW